MDKFNIAVLGDSFLDKFSFFTSNRMSPEADVPVAIDEKQKLYPGGASLVSSVIAKNGISVDLYTRIGSDSNSLKLHKLISEHSVNIYDYSENYETILKNRVIVNGKYFLRIDNENLLDITNPKKLINEFKNNIQKYDYIVLSDYNKGFFSEAVSKSLQKLEIENKTILDPKPGSKLSMKNWAFLKPNYDEGVLISSKNSPGEIINKINKSFNTNTLLTMGSEGVFYQNLQTNLIEQIVPDKKIKVTDASGSGDIFLGNFISKYIFCNNLKESIKFAIKATHKPLLQYGYW